MRIKSFAKINLGLEVVRKRGDKYHEIRTLFQTIDFYDSLHFRRTPHNKISLEGTDDTISWGEDNLIYKAASLLKQQFNLTDGIEIQVTKNIPAGKGLGGGSSNAAMTLYALNKIWELHLGKSDMMDLGRNIGADVPYFFEGGLCLGLGRGDSIIPLAEHGVIHCLLVLPAISILTASIYKRFRFSLTSNLKDSKIIRFLGSRDFGLLENNLEETVFSLYPQLRTIKSHLQSQGSELSLVSGTGSSVYGLFLNKEKAEEVFKALKKSNSVFLAETLSRERYVRYLSAGV